MGDEEGMGTEVMGLEEAVAMFAILSRGREGEDRDLSRDTRRCIWVSGVNKFGSNIPGSSLVSL
jgi:hypothetical protein